MRIDKNKLDRVLAEQCKVASDLRQLSFSPSTITRIRQGHEINTKTAGKLAKALGVTVTDLLEEECLLPEYQAHGTGVHADDK